MRLIAPGTGVAVEAHGHNAERLMALGFAPAEAKKHSRPTKKELLEEVGETKTNPEIAEFLDKPKPKKKSKAKTKK